MLYRILKFFAPLALHFYCRQLCINKPDWLNVRGPVLLAANHPNSFLDAVLLCTLFKQPVYSLARGDVFKRRWIAKLLMKLNMYPVFRLSEGSENVANNYDTFDKCISLFKKGEIVLIFSEGLCINEWRLRRLKKGTARLAMAAWQQDIQLTVLPVGINYSSFVRFGKNIHLFFGAPIQSELVEGTSGEGAAIRQFNSALQQELQAVVYEIPKHDKALQQQQFRAVQPNWKQLLLALPAVVGFVFHAPLFWLVKLIYNITLGDSDHYDSFIVGLLFLTYPVFLLLLFLGFAVASHWAIGLLLLLLLPFTAWCYVQVKPQF